MSDLGEEYLTGQTEKPSPTVVAVPPPVRRGSGLGDDMEAQV